MATIQATVTHPADNVVRFTWPLMANTDVGAPIGPNWASYSDRNVSIPSGGGAGGTFGVGGTLTVQGSSNSGATYESLTDQSDNALAIIATKTEQIMQITDLTRPAVTAGDGTTSLTVTITMRKNPRN